MKTTRTPASIAIVTPCYNEEQGIREFYRVTRGIVETLNIPYSFVFVDDGSSDQTLDVLNELANEDPCVSVISFARNFGHQIALSAGLDYAEADVIITMDSDLQHPPEKIPDMVAKYEAGADIVYGVRQDDLTRGFLKRTFASVFYKLLKRATSTEVIYGAVDFRLLSRQALSVLKSMRERHRYLRGMIPWMGFPYATVTYEQQQRLHGTSQYSWRQLAQLARHGLFSFSTLPLDFITYLGVFMNILAGIYLLYILFVALFTTRLQEIPGWTSTIILILIVGGIQLISIGIVAQYIGMIFEQVKERPLYTVKQKRLQKQYPEEDV